MREGQYTRERQALGALDRNLWEGEIAIQRFDGVPGFMTRTPKGYGFGSFEERQDLMRKLAQIYGDELGQENWGRTRDRSGGCTKVALHCVRSGMMILKLQ